MAKDDNAHPEDAPPRRGRGVKILLLATRPTDAPLTGRKAVLRTIVRSCESLGHAVDIAVIGPAGANPRFASVPAPGIPTVLANVVRHFVFGRKSLNECLYWSPKAQRQIARLVADGGHDVVIADMVRTAQYCPALGVPWVLDLDDLLSDRYANFADTRDGRTLLGYFSERVPRLMRRAAALLTRRVLLLESRRMAAQESYFGERADSVTLVSPAEARKLSGRLQRPVHDTAMSVDLPPPTEPGPVAADHEHTDHAVAFLGGLDYQPNLDAVTHYLDHIAPGLAQRGSHVALHVIGNAPPALRPADPSGSTVYLGYVDDLAETLGHYGIFVAPIVTGGGVKVKVLEAMAHGLAVVATEQAVAGLGVTPNRECIVADTPNQFAAAIDRLDHDADECARLGQAARRFVGQRFSRRRMQEKWRVLLADAIAHGQAQARVQAAAGSGEPYPTR